MEELEKQINKKIEILKEKISSGKSKEEIEKERKELDRLLNKYLKDL